MTVKNAVIFISLVKESTQKTNNEIKKEILQALEREIFQIPWCKEIKDVIIKEES